MYKRVSSEERELIAKGLAKNQSLREIARRLKRAPSTIFREISRLSQGIENYSVIASDADAKDKQKTRVQGKKKIIGALKKLVDSFLKKRWSPEQISCYLKLSQTNTSMQISYETIYQYIYSQPQKKRKILVFSLRQKKKKRRRRNPKYEQRGKIKNAISIHERAKEVEERKTFGHWEGDLIIGKNHKTAIGTLVERKSRLVKIVFLPNGKDSFSVIQAFEAVFSVIPKNMKKSLTYDRGQEMALHETFTESTGIPVYFADPRSPWQRGTNENTNGLVRDFFPKKTDFSIYSAEDFQVVEDLLNQRPRKIIGFQTPQAIFENAICTN